jgi:UDP-N-acetylmuramoyl-L-alanyl-D-glutamate--2,6-diaminopimelate ligase
MKTLGQILEGLEILSARGDMDTPVTGIYNDSRQAVPGSLFVCVPGSRLDGHAFIGDAVARGAVAIVAESERVDHGPTAFIRVRDSRRALASMSANYYDHPASKLALIGITGTNGKTTTSLLIESILRCAGHNPGVLGTLAYRWAGKEIPAPMTTPESVQLQKIFYEMLRDGVTHVVMEVSSHALALGRVEGCAFRTGVFTNLSQDHLDFHETMEEYFSAKKLLFCNYLDPRSSMAVINADDAYGRRMLENGACGTKALGYSAEVPPGVPSSTGDGSLACNARDVEFTAGGISALVDTPRGTIKVESPLVGRLNLYNVLAAVSTAVALDIPGEAIATGIRALTHVDGRLQRVEVPHRCGFQVIVDYAHTPDAMDKALACLREMTSNKLIVVFGCGGDRDRGKRPLMGRIAAERADFTIITSDNPRTEVPEEIVNEIEAGMKEAGICRFAGFKVIPDEKCYTREVDRHKAIELALSLARPGDVIFIGGKGHETYQIIGTTKYPFDDRLVVKDYFRNQVSD